MDGLYLKSEMKKVNDWLRDNVLLVQRDGFAKDIHIDEIADMSDSTSNKIIEESIRISKVFFSKFLSLNVDELCLYLSIDLREYGNVLKGAPENFADLCSQYDIYTMPEIILYKPLPEFPIANVEIYRKPLSLEEFKYERARAFYKEYRTAEEIAINMEYRREINFVCSSSM